MYLKKYKIEMDPPPKPPRKRRKFKAGGMLREDDEEAADAVEIHTEMRATDQGLQEITWKQPIWLNHKNTQPDARASGASSQDTSQSSAERHLDRSDPIGDDPTMFNDDVPATEINENHPRTQNSYLEEYVKRCHTMLEALLSREALTGNTKCAHCSNIGKWRCKDCTMARLVCRNCMRTQHKDGALHRIEEWTGTYFRKAELRQVGVYILVPHHQQANLCPALQFQNDNLERRNISRDDIEQRELTAGYSDTLGSVPQLSRNNEEAYYKQSHHNSSSNISYEQERDEDMDTDKQLDQLYKNHFVDHRPADGDGGGNDNGTADSNAPADSNRHPTTDAFNNPYVRVIHTNGFHYMPLVYCDCQGRENTHSDLMAVGILPSSFKRYQTVFTHSVLEDFRLTSLECKASAYQYNQKLCRQTSSMFPDEYPNLYAELRRMSRIWRWLKRLKWAGVGHRPRNTELVPGELANFCPACPQPGLNLPDNWHEDPKRYYYPGP